jgi:predicted transcriptional regulator
MPASKALLEQLLTLPDELSEELGYLLCSDEYVDRAMLGQALLDAVMEDMTPEEEAALNASIDESYADMEAGRTRPAEEVIAELRARSAQRAAG